IQNDDEVHVVNPMGNANIKNIDIEGLKASYAPQKIIETGGIIVDERDAKQYNWVSIGQYDWLTSNLAFETPESKCFEDENWIDCNTYGRYYTWETALNACPEGWKLPSVDEWNMLLTELGGGNNAYQKLTNNNPQGIQLKTGGYYYDKSTFVNTGEYGYFWTSTPDGAGSAICIWLNPVEGSLLEFSSSTAHYRNIRCVRE
ncbi:MAG: hypothetical protein JW798_03300, partial [Prolixibacteraceae bacterium]|nr:hypothetical protein [Prolixibacteraceae bacterium]